MQERITSDQYFGQIAQATALRSTCNKIKVGCILTLDKRIISSGFNGSAKGFPHCIDVGCLLDSQNKCIRTIHAETNALIQAHTTTNAELWCTHLPCFECCKCIANSGVKRVSFIEYYLDPKCSIFPDYDENVNYQIDLLSFAGIDVHLIKM